MDNRVGVGIFVGLIFSSTLYVIQSDSFTRTQRIILLIATICFPIQWIGIIICLVYNNYKENNTEEKITERNLKQKTNTLNSQIENLNDLKEKGILTEEEFNQKVLKIEQEKTEENIKNSQEYKQLKSLLDSGVLTKEEFEDKVKIISNISEKGINEKEIKSILFSVNKNYLNSLDNTNYYKINNLIYSLETLKDAIKNEEIKLYRNTIVTLQDGTTKTLENIYELKDIIEILKNK